MTPGAPSRPRRPRHPRGFVLIICVIASVAMVAIAMALVFTAGSNRIVAAKGSAIDESESIAIAGLERAVAYAERVAEVERDYDQLLDPALDIACVARTADDAILGTSGLPRFTDGDAAVVDGISYRRVAYGRGAYLVRFDDDVDDSVDNPAWAPFTNNHTVNDCDEGPGPSGFPGGHNAFRDRNRTVWISVIGIYPGVEIAKARHRTSLRRLHISTARLPAPAFFVGDDLKARDFTFCSALGDVASRKKIELSGDRSCGTLTASDDISAAGGDPGPVCTTSDEECAPRAAPAPHTPLPDFNTIAALSTGKTNLLANARSWFDTGQPQCNLFARDGDFGGLFFWDPTRPGCDDGAADADPGPPAIGITASWTSCWVPLFAFVGPLTTNPLGWSEVDASSNDSWKPNDAAETPATPLFSANKPDWSECTVRWKTGADVSCSACDGANVVVGHSGNKVVVNGSNPEASPAVTLRFAGDVNGGNFTAMSAPAFDNDADNVADDWMKMTLLIGGDMNLGNDDVAFGFGLSGFSPSVVIDKKLKMDGTGSFDAAGSVLVKEVELKGNSAFTSYGMVLVRQKFDGGGSTSVKVDYDEDLSGGAPPPVPAAPTTSRTIR
jgi:hypothetical protein